MVEAKVLFKTDTGKSFTLDHCWGILHHSPKWLKHLEDVGPGKSSSKSKSTATAEDLSSDLPSNDGLDPTPPSDSSIRPEGQKASKKRKHDEFSLANLIKQQKELLDISREKQKAFESFADDMVMGRDLASMDDETRAYFIAKRKKAIERSKKD